MKKILFVGIIALIILMIFGAGYTNWSYSFNDHDVVVTVTDKDRIVDFDTNESKYLIMGEDENGNPVVFENTDNFIRGKFNSSNFQAGISIGKTYRLTVVGERIPYFSMYENIINYEELNIEWN